jgi:hypothetical protein
MSFVQTDAAILPGRTTPHRLPKLIYPGLSFYFDLLKIGVTYDLPDSGKIVARLWARGMPVVLKEILISALGQLP